MLVWDGEIGSGRYGTSSYRSVVTDGGWYYRVVIVTCSTCACFSRGYSCRMGTMPVRVIYLCLLLGVFPGLLARSNAVPYFNPFSQHKLCGGIPSCAAVMGRCLGGRWFQGLGGGYGCSLSGSVQGWVTFI